MKTDLIVIGGGPGGYLAAERAAQGGLSVTLFEEASLGGVCLNEGCIPSKTLLHSAKVLDYATHGEAYGVSVRDAHIDLDAVIKRKNKVVKTLVAGVKGALKAHGVTVVPARAQILGKQEEGFAVAAGAQTYVADRLLLATGSAPVIPPIPGLREGLQSGFVMTNREILNLTQLPQQLVVVGGGVIGLEMASYYRSIGACVTIVEMLNKIGGQTEDEIAGLLQADMQSRGIEFLLGTKVTGILPDRVQVEKDGQQRTLPADAVLLSIGRRPVVKEIGLENIGVYVEQGAIVTDAHMRTNLSGVYAVGDCNGKSMLAHTAYREAEVAVHHMLQKRDTMRYDAIPAVIYTNPEVACIGETEQTAHQKGIPVKVAKLSMRYAGRYIAETSGGNGICKMLVHEQENRVVGVHLYGSYASEMLYGAAFMIESRYTIEELKEIVFPHPTVSEILREALFAI